MRREIKMKKILILIIALLILAPTTALAAAKKQKVGYVGITYETKDSFVIKSKLFYPAKPQSVYPVVVMLHSLGYSSDYWGNIPKKFIDEGAAVLMIDLRGHGQSMYDSNFRIRSWQYFTKNTYEKYPSDISDIIKYVASNHKNLSTTKYAIVGADIGANTAILAAEKLPNQPAAMVLISPTREFKWLYTPIALTNLHPFPILSMVSARDPYSNKESQALKKFAQGEFDIKIYPAGSMGMLMLKANPSMGTDIVNWVMPKIK